MQAAVMRDSERPVPPFGSMAQAGEIALDIETRPLSDIAVAWDAHGANSRRRQVLVPESMRNVSGTPRRERSRAAMVKLFRAI